MKILVMGLFALCLGLGTVSASNLTVSTPTTAAAEEKDETPQDILARAKAEGANWNEAQWKEAMRDMTRALSPALDFMRDIEEKLEKADDAEKAKIISKLTEIEEKMKDLEVVMDEFEKVMEASEIGKKVNNDKAFEEELKKEFNLPDDF